MIKQQVTDPVQGLGGDTQLSFWYQCAAQRAENRGLENRLLPNLAS